MMDDMREDDHTWIQEQSEDTFDPLSLDNIINVSLSQFGIYKAMKAQTQLHSCGNTYLTCTKATFTRFN